MAPALARAQPLLQFRTVSELPVCPTWRESVKLKSILPLENGGVTLEEAGVNSRLSVRQKAPERVASVVCRKVVLLRV
jgi:hypothetical protein